MARNLGARAPDLFLAPKRNHRTRLAHLPPSATPDQFPLVHPARPALFPDYVVNPLPAPAEPGLSKLPLLHLAHDRMDKVTGS
jgi:hypothetical protein